MDDAKQDPSNVEPASDEDESPTAPGEDRQATTLSHSGSAAQPGLQIGPYRLLQPLGEGGMGEVWEAEQERPVRRRVALKLIKWGMDTKAVIARFEAERQALALMDHPNVAKVLDAGATEFGRPYFAMELVKGEPITKHCDRQRLTTKQRLQLFMQVCGGVQHAHQRGIIHRDIKPSNILVQVDGETRTPKIIDFGVAKATQQRLTERTVFTELGQLVGTPEYMSPEQAEMTVEDIDVRTDVYSLGVILYELLAGALPVTSSELRSAAFPEIVRRIREEEPPRPSARLSTMGTESVEAARRRRTDLSSLRRQLTGDLDWIVMRALEKDRTRRYSSASEFAADIERFMTNELVLARPPSAAYRMGKFARRHKRQLAVVSVLVLLAIASGVAIVTSARARQASVRADLEALRREEVAAVADYQLGRLSVDELAPIVQRLESRITGDRSTPIDHYLYARALAEVRPYGRFLQRSGERGVGFFVSTRLGLGVSKLLGLRMQMKLETDGASTVDQRRGRFVFPVSSGLSLGVEGSKQTALGKHRLAATLECCVVRIPNGESAEWSSAKARKFANSVDCIGPVVYLDVPPIDYVVVSELPPGYPVAVREPDLLTGFLERFSVEPLRFEPDPLGPTKIIIGFRTAFTPLPSGVTLSLVSATDAFAPIDLGVQHLGDGWSTGDSGTVQNVDIHIRGHGPESTAVRLEITPHPEQLDLIRRAVARGLLLRAETDVENIEDSDGIGDFYLHWSHSWPLTSAADEAERQ